MRVVARTFFDTEITSITLTRVFTLLMLMIITLKTLSMMPTQEIAMTSVIFKRYMATDIF